MENWVLYIKLALILVAVIYIKIKLSKTQKTWKKEIASKLNQISQNEQTQNPLEWKALLVEIDKLLDYAFKKRGIKGETMGDRLKNAKSFYNYLDYQNTWEAHKTRNKIAHEFDAKMSVSKMKKHYMILKRSIQAII